MISFNSSMKFQPLLALAVGLTLVVSPKGAIAQSSGTASSGTASSGAAASGSAASKTAQASRLAAQSERLPVPKLKPGDTDSSLRSIDSLVQAETTWLNRPPSAERTQQLETLKRELIAQALEVHGKSHGPSVTVPSHTTTLYFQDLLGAHPKSGILASLYAESLSMKPVDQGQVERVYDQLMTQHSRHPVFLASYRDAVLRQYDQQLPGPLAAKLTALYDRALAQRPTDLNLYLDRAAITPKDTAAIFQQWQTAAAKLPANPQVATEFARLIVNTQIANANPDPQVFATTIARVEAAMRQFPKAVELYEAYAYLHTKANLDPKKALPALEAGLAQGADPAVLHILVGDIHLLSGSEAQAMQTYQKIVQAKSPLLCKSNMAERFKVVKQPEQQRALLNLLLQSVAFDSADDCPDDLTQIVLHPPINQQFGPEATAAIAPIAQSRASVELRTLYLQLLQSQKQYGQIVQVGPQLLPTAATELELYNFLVAENLPLIIASAHEKLGNLDQAIRFYQLLGEYHKVSYTPSVAERDISYVASWHLGRVAWKQGKAQEAIALLRPVTTHSLSNWSLQQEDGSEVSYRALAHNLMGEIFQSQGKTTEAKQQFEASAKADQAFKTPRENLAKLK
jgi:tetratricopeptide (TPR) repeat protein